METVSEPENLGLSEKHGIEESTVDFLQIMLIIMQLRPHNVILWKRRTCFKHDWSQGAWL